MLQFMQRLVHRRDDEKGASAVEYGLLVAAIAAIIVLIVFAIGKFVKAGFATPARSGTGQLRSASCRLLPVLIDTPRGGRTRHQPCPTPHLSGRPPTCGSEERTLDERGASAVEYGLLVAAIAAIIVVIVFAVGKFTGAAFSDTCDEPRLWRVSPVPTRARQRRPWTRSA